MLQLDRVRRQFGGQILFDELTWLIRPGDRLALIGPNGAGKTTLLRIICGKETADAGVVHRPRDLKIGYLPQEVETVDSGSALGVTLSGFDEIARLDRRLQQMERRLATLKPGDAGEDGLAAAYGELRHRFEALEGDRLEARAKAILSGLGIPVASFHDPLETLSGGWRMRVVLARLLLAAPRLLLLDEPTNHLDLEAIGWLETFLESYEGAFLVVSHDRYFLNRMVRDVVELDRGKLTRYAGNYDDYVAAKRDRAVELEKAARHQARERAKVERFIERFRYKNTKARQVQSRIRALGKIERIETAHRSRKIRFGFPPAPRSGDIVVRAEQVDKRFGSTVVYGGMNLLLRRGDRVALVGPNGAGKSTLLNMLAGRLAPDRGKLELGHNVEVQYYAQHQLDDLDPDATVLAEIERAAPPAELPRMRKLLGCFLFGGDDVTKPVRVLSGGEKARLALARLLVRSANLLLLDEPTNHLDLRSREVLEEALDEYDGTLMLISHDRYFINRVATSVGEVGRGGVELREGAYDEYLEWLERRPQPCASEREAGVAEAPATAARKVEKRKEAEQRNRIYRERKAVEQRLAPIEREISELERRTSELQNRQADPAVYSDPDRSREVAREMASARGRLEQLYADWEAAALTESDERE